MLASDKANELVSEGRGMKKTHKNKSKSNRLNQSINHQSINRINRESKSEEEEKEEKRKEGIAIAELSLAARGN